MNISYLLIGGNEGDRKGSLALAREYIARQIGEILRISSLYRTAAWGKTDQPDFLNQALEVSTSLNPEELLSAALDIEEKMGRRRMEKYGPRIIDIDILFFNDAVVHMPGLVIPHPEIQNRRFVLVPMNEIAPGLTHPVLGSTIGQLLDQCSDPLDVRKF